MPADADSSRARKRRYGAVVGGLAAAGAIVLALTAYDRQLGLMAGYVVGTTLLMLAVALAADRLQK